jgi:hypothetical protein
VLRLRSGGTELSQDGGGGAEADFAPGVGVELPVTRNSADAPIMSQVANAASTAAVMGRRARARSTTLGPFGDSRSERRFIA